MKKIISFRLNPTSIDNAIKELEKYTKDFNKKKVELRKAIAEELKKEIENIVRMSMVDDLVDGGYKKPNVTTTISDSGENTTLVTAIGSDIIWIEFGSGVHYNGKGRPNPYSSKIPGVVPIGTYGLGHGKQDKWAFNDGERVVWTYGTKATMPMYNATKKVLKEIPNIARKVFGK